MFDEDNLILISAIQHYRFCPRQCALIHTEKIWQENQYTAEGLLLHSKAHSLQKETRQKIIFQYSLPVRSLEFGIIGKCDLVEFHYEDNRHKQLVNAVPVEYKRGRAKKSDYDALQLYAQTLCLEEMLGIQISYGYLFYHKVKRRLKINFNEDVRKETLETIAAVRDLLNSNTVPKAVYSASCKRCSLYSQCKPEIFSKEHRIDNYIKKNIELLTL
ncbi:MAG: CRISPR-associated protein Cas4 [Spirochaetales bacterium]|nr:CRISPR-associated protein Cas4 [Spirochaetales bacterium]